MRYPAVAIALLAALPLMLLATWSLSRDIPHFSDPCFEWATPQRASIRISPGDPCRALGGTSETKVQAVMRMSLISGGMLLASLLGILGALLARPGLSVLGAGLIFLEAIPLIFSFAWLAVIVSGLFLLAARATAPLHGTASIGTRLIGSLGGLAALWCLPSLFRGTPLFLLFLLIVLVFVAVAGWWPIRTAAREH